ncbi:Linearmycin resistance ATP-binding protein LnrL [Firmicutes bacterium ASF500]|nr:Linearmycin resistance ATP-binding protein LnrL [Firmicutes bacterium ASF500]
MAHRRISALSKGYKQRVGIAQALLGNPKVIILDEPTVGLDPIQIIEIRDLIKELGQTHTVIFSSHILSEVQAICDQIIMIAKGKLVAFDTPENLEKHLLSPNEVVLTSDDSAAEIRVLLEGVDHITDLTLEETGTGLVTARIKTDLSNVYDLSRSVFSAFAASGKALLELTVKKANLEDIFLELAETDDGASEPPAVEAEIVESEAAEE